MVSKGRPTKLEDPDKNAWCSKCQSEKAKDLFYKNRSRANGLDSRCKKCNHSNKRERSKSKTRDESMFVGSIISDEERKKLYEILRERRERASVYSISSEPLSISCTVSPDNPYFFGVEGQEKDDK